MGKAHPAHRIAKLRMNSSERHSNHSRSQQFKFVPTEPIIPPSASRVSNKAYTQISQMLGIQKKMRDLSDNTCYPWQIDCKWTPPGLRKKKQ
jgi:hypothetical protein